MRQALALCCRTKGSVIPFVLAVTLPNVLLTFALKWSQKHQLFQVDVILNRYEIDAPAFTTFSSLLGFFLVFRLQQAYLRWVKGYSAVQRMVGAWYDTASNLMAFTHMSQAELCAVDQFKHTLVRLFSVLGAVGLVEMQGDALETEGLYIFRNVELLGFNDLDSSTIGTLRREESKAELVFHWIHRMIADGQQSGVISVPPPLLTHALQSLFSGWMAFQDGKRLGSLKFPFPYAQASFWLLIIHWIVTPVNMCFWTQMPETSAGFSFLSTFIFWSMYKICHELENPFGVGPNHVDCQVFQDYLNSRLLSLLGSSPEGLAVTRVPCMRDIKKASGSDPLIRTSTVRRFNNQFSGDLHRDISHRLSSHNATPVGPSSPFEGDVTELYWDRYKGGSEDTSSDRESNLARDVEAGETGPAAMSWLKGAFQPLKRQEARHFRAPPEDFFDLPGNSMDPVTPSSCWPSAAAPQPAACGSVATTASSVYGWALTAEQTMAHAGCGALQLQSEHFGTAAPAAAPGPLEVGAAASRWGAAAAGSHPELPAGSVASGGAPRARREEVGRPASAVRQPPELAAAAAQDCPRAPSSVRSNGPALQREGPTATVRQQPSKRG